MASSQAAKLGRATARLWIRHRSSLQANPHSHVVTRSLGRGLRHFARRCGSVFAHLGLQISAVLYLAFALSFGFAGWKGWRADHLHPGAHASAATQLELALTVVFLYFGLSSLLRAAARRS
ncbi:MAG TPA: hypothetical protein VFP94_07930 [Terriglobales bacterium]|nr:hypothetical protein [Terriglobales bacterium]